MDTVGMIELVRRINNHLVTVGGLLVEGIEGDAAVPALEQAEDLLEDAVGVIKELLSQQVKPE